MEIRTSLVRGSEHHLQCEDCNFVEQDTKHILFAVMDGCSGGKESVFTSHLFKKILTVIWKDTSWTSWNFIDTAQLLRYVLIRFYYYLRNSKNLLRLDITELESTLLLGIINKETKRFSFLFYGDGFAVVDNEIVDNDQNNIPKYPAHFLHLSFKDFYEQASAWHGKFENNIGLATDGIASFREPETNKKIDVSRILLCDNWLHQNPTCLTRKINILKNGNSPEFPDQKLYHTDDISIVRIINY